MKNGLARKTIAAAAFLALVPVAGWGSPGGEKGFRGPSPETYAACEGKKAGDQVEFKNRRGETVKGLCTEVDGRLAARKSFGKADGTGHLARMATVLELTEEQQAKIRGIHEAQRDACAPVREKMAANRQKLQQAVRENDEGAIRALSVEGATLKADHLVHRARTWKEVREVLTPAQQEKAEKLADTRGKRHGKGCRSW